MNAPLSEARSVVVERELPHPPQKIWRALTQPELMEEWLMKSDFVAAIDHRFSFRADWGHVDCQVLKLEPHRTLSYSWGDSRLESIVTWTLRPTATGTHLMLEQTGFRHDQPRYFQGATEGWPRFLGRLETLLDGMD
ncbi:MAG: SRPBCC domain-containing protein [Rhizobium sp.]|nr:SRPBCC domain-containing protein [Rhizobium sp.]